MPNFIVIEKNNQYISENDTYPKRRIWRQQFVGRCFLGWIHLEAGLRMKYLPTSQPQRCPSRVPFAVFCRPLKDPLCRLELRLCKWWDYMGVIILLTNHTTVHKAGEV